MPDDKQLFQARDVSTDVVTEFQAASKTARARTYGQFFEHVWAFYKAHGGLETKIPSLVDRSPPLERGMGSEGVDTTEESGTKSAARGRKPSGSRAKKARTINPRQRPMGEQR